METPPIETVRSIRTNPDSVDPGAVGRLFDASVSDGHYALRECTLHGKETLERLLDAETEQLLQDMFVSSNPRPVETGILALLAAERLEPLEALLTDSSHLARKDGAKGAMWTAIGSPATVEPLLDLLERRLSDKVKPRSTAVEALVPVASADPSYRASLADRLENGAFDDDAESYVVQILSMASRRAVNDGADPTQFVPSLERALDRILTDEMAYPSSATYQLSHAAAAYPPFVRATLDDIVDAVDICSAPHDRIAEPIATAASRHRETARAAATLLEETDDPDRQTVLARALADAVVPGALSETTAQQLAESDDEDVRTQGERLCQQLGLDRFDEESDTHDDDWPTQLRTADGNDHDETVTDELATAVARAASDSRELRNELATMLYSADPEERVRAAQVFRTLANHDPEAVVETDGEPLRALRAYHDEPDPEFTIEIADKEVPVKTDPPSHTESRALSRVQSYAWGTLTTVGKDHPGVLEPLVPELLERLDDAEYERDYDSISTGLVGVARGHTEELKPYTDTLLEVFHSNYEDAMRDVFVALAATDEEFASELIKRTFRLPHDNLVPTAHKTLAMLAEENPDRLCPYLESDIVPALQDDNPDVREQTAKNVLAPLAVRRPEAVAEYSDQIGQALADPVESVRVAAALSAVVCLAETEREYPVFRERFESLLNEQRVEPSNQPLLWDRDRLFGRRLAAIGLALSADTPRPTNEFESIEGILVRYLAELEDPFGYYEPWLGQLALDALEIVGTAETADRLDALARERPPSGIQSELLETVETLRTG